MLGNLYISNSKKSIFFILKMVFFLFILSISLILIGRKYYTARDLNTISSYNKLRFEDFYNMEKNTLDLAFLGSSHSYCSFDPEIFDKKLNINSIQMGMPLQRLDSTYYTLLEILNYQKPKAVVVEIYWDMLDEKFEGKQAEMFLRELRNDNLKKDYIKNVFSSEDLLKHSLNIFKYQADYFKMKGSNYSNRIANKFNLNISEKEKQFGQEKYKNKGFIFSDYKMLKSEYNETNQFKGFDGKNWSINKTQKKFLEKIIDTCKKNNIKLFFVTAPIAPVSINFITNYKNINHTISKLAQENNIEYIDFNIINNEEKILTNENFRDDAHLNYSGAEIISNRLADELNYKN